MKPHIFTELYVRDVASTAKLFQEIFGAEVVTEQSDFAELHIGDSRLLLNILNLDEFEAANPVLEPGAIDHLGAGLELGIYVDDLDGTYEKVRARELPHISDIKAQARGLRDFRFRLPEGYYIRVTSA